MGKYSIKELEQLSGIKAHTIRIWEKRHRLIEPQRTETNIRFYSDEDLKTIMNVSLLNTNGYKISKIASMSDDEIREKILHLSKTREDGSVYIDQLVVAMVDLEEEKYEKILSTVILRYGFEETIIKVVYPFLEKIGILWQTKNITPAQEHFISNLVRQKIIVAIDALPFAPKDARKVILFLPENEFHEIGLLFYNYLFRKAGYQTIYLGQTVPYNDLRSIRKVYQATLLVTSITTLVIKPQLDTYLTNLASDFQDCEIWASGLQVLEFGDSQWVNVRFFRNISELKHLTQQPQGQF